MKRKVLLSINLALLFALFIGLFGVEDDVSAVTSRNGTSGDCAYEMDENGNLVVRPIDGTECTLGNMEDNNTSAPWNSFRLDVATVAFENTVKTAGSARGLFFGLLNATRIDLTGLDTSGTTNMEAMFRSCQSVEELDVSGLDTSNVTNMREMFYYNDDLTSLNLGNFDTSNVTDMRQMFFNDKSLTKLDLRSFDTSNVTDMYGMFWQMRALTDLNVTSFNTSKVENFGRFLQACDSLREIDLSSFDTTGATNMVLMFGNGEYALKYITVSNELDLKPTTFYGASFGRGMYQNVETGEMYPAVQISDGGMAGTYKRVSKISDEFDADYVVEYRIDKATRIDEFTTTDENVFYNPDNRSVLAKIPLTTVEELKVLGGFSVVYKDIVSDVDGNKYNFKMEFSNIKFYDLVAKDGVDEVYAEITGLGQLSETAVYNEKSIGLFGKYYLSLDDYLAGVTTTVNTNYDSKSYDIVMSVVDDEGNPVEGSFIFSINDLDGSSYRDRNSGHPDLLMENRGFGEYSEGVYLGEGFDMDTLVKSRYSDLLIMDQNRITGLSIDNYTERSEFMIKADSMGSEFTWTTGDGMNSTILSRYQPEIIEIANIDEDGGEELPGARLELYHGDTLVETWESGATGKKFWVMPGMYTLKAVSAPDGYEVVTDEIVFFVDAENGIMVDGEVVDRVEAIDRKPEEQPDEGDDEKPDEGDDEKKDDEKKDDESGDDEKKDEDGEPEEVEVPNTGSFTGGMNGVTVGSGVVIIAILTIFGYLVKKSKRV